MLDSVSRGRSPSPGLSEIRSGNGLTAIGTPAVTSGTDTQVFQLDHRLTWLRGRHAWKTGATWQHYRMQRYFSGNNGVLGQIGFDGSFTGVPFGDCLLDLVSVKGRGSLAEPWTHLQHRVAVYGADNVKVTGALTATIGLRWAFSSPLVETDDRQANVSLTNGQPLLAGRDGNSRALYEPFYGGWEPRVGLAYRPHERWVVRGAYGITQSMEGTGANLRLTLNPPFFFESEARYDRTSGAGTVATGIRRAAHPRCALRASARVGSRAAPAVRPTVERVRGGRGRLARVDGDRIRGLQRAQILPASAPRLPTSKARTSAPSRAR
jgi:hypothetical protein